MTDRDPLNEMLAALDRPATPDPFFAANLRRHLLASLGEPRATQGDQLAMTAISLPRALGTSPTAATERSLPIHVPRPRWGTLLEIAALLLLLTGGWRAWDATRRPAAIPAVTTSPHDPVPAAMWGGTPGRTGEQPGPAPTGELEVAWTVSGDGESRGDSPAIAVNDTLFRVVDDAVVGPAVEARSLLDGGSIWRTPVSAVGNPAATGAMVYIVATDTPSLAASLVALDARSGSERWRQPLGDQIGARDGSPIVFDGAVYTVDPDGTARAFDAETGAERWIAIGAVATTNPSESAQARIGSPASFGQFAVGDKALYLVNSDGDLAALDLTDGSVLWKLNVYERFAIDPEAVRPIAIGDAVVLYAFGYDARPDAGSMFLSLVAALDASTGADRWSARFGEFSDEPVIAGDIVLIRLGAGAKGITRGLDLATGKEEWNAMGATGAPPYFGAPVAVGSLAVAVTPGDGLVAAVHAESGTEAWRFQTDEELTGAVLVAGGMVVVQGRDGSLIAIGGASASSSTPTA